MKSSSLTVMSDLASKSAEVANILRELANEKRLLVLCTLLDLGETSVAELADRVALSQSALSQHLARLRDQDAVTFRRDGTTLYYRVSDSRIARLMKSLKSIYC
jgi:DNA-binding transcriptional ArsR family regulator